MNIVNREYYQSYSIFVIERIKLQNTVGIVPYAMRENNLYTDGTHFLFMFVDDQIVTDLTLFRSMCNLAPADTDVRDIYYLYLEAKYPAYTYH